MAEATRKPPGGRWSSIVWMETMHCFAAVLLAWLEKHL